MSESEQQRGESPLQSERGATIISDTVVSTIAGMAAQEVEGVHMGGGASRTASGMLGSLTGSESKTSGISVEVGRTEAAIDLKMGIEYNRNIRQAVEEVRRRITDRVQSMTGLRITELNATITDITFPKKEERRRLGSRSATSERDASAEESDATPETRTMPRSEPRSGASERETTEVEASVEGRPLEEDETAKVRPDDTQEEERVTDEALAASGEAETSAEARRRRRAEERARRRRRTEDG